MALRSYLLKNSMFIRIQQSESVAFPYFVLPIESQKIMFTLNPIDSLRQLKDEIASRLGQQDVTFFGGDGSKLSLSSSVIDSTIDPLYIKIGIDKMFTLYNLNANQLHLTPHQRTLAQQYEKEKKLNREEAEVIGTFNFYIFKELNEYPSPEVDSETFSLIVKNAILQFGTQVSHQRKMFEAQLKLFKSQHAFELEVHDEVTQKAASYAQKVIKRFYNVILFQFLAVQYGTYHLYSWDIMEPITCMMAMADVSIGYMFWMLSDRHDYGMEGIKKYYFNKKYKKLLKRKGVNLEEMKTILQTINDIEERIKNT
jgi:hypothetical protein